MKLALNNIGIISDAVIDLPGLTVITGKNSSGKSTVGKALYGVVDGGIHVRDKYKDDIKDHIRSTLEDVQDDFIELRYLVDTVNTRNINGDEGLKAIFSEYPYLWKLLNDEMYYDLSATFVSGLYDELTKIDIVDLIERLNNYRLRIGQDTLNGQTDHIQARVENAKNRLRKTQDFIQREPNLIGFAARNIYNTVQKEFNNQILPVNWKADTGEILLEGDENLFLDLKIGEDNAPRGFVMSPEVENSFDDVFMLDDPLVIDDISERTRKYVYKYNPQIDELGYHRMILDHREKLQSVLSDRKPKNLLEEMEKDEANKEVISKMNQMLKGDFVSDNSGEFILTSSGNKLNISNLATGAKMVALLEMLFNNGNITKDTLLIFDEPESHLHPEWQNIFAETIVLMMKTIGTRIIMTTHSPSFLYALETYSVKYGVKEKTAYYSASIDENGHGVIKDVSNDVGLIYSDFLGYLLDMKALREKMGME